MILVSNWRLINQAELLIFNKLGIKVRNLKRQAAWVFIE